MTFLKGQSKFPNVLLEVNAVITTDPLHQISILEIREIVWEREDSENKKDLLSKSTIGVLRPLILILRGI